MTSKESLCEHGVPLWLDCQEGCKPRAPADPKLAPISPGALVLAAMVVMEAKENDVRVCPLGEYGPRGGEAVVDRAEVFPLPPDVVFLQSRSSHPTTSILSNWEEWESAVLALVEQRTGGEHIDGFDSRVALAAIEAGQRDSTAAITCMAEAAMHAPESLAPYVSTLLLQAIAIARNE